MLMEHETQKIRELDEQCAGELKEWKAQLRPRKQVMWTLVQYYSRPWYSVFCRQWCSVCVELGTVIFVDLGILLL